MSRSLRSLFLGCLATGLLTASVAAQAELVANGGFETGDFTGWAISNVDPNYLSSGIETTLTPDQIPPTLIPQPVPGGYVFEGEYSAFFGNLRSAPGMISQSIATVPGTTYIVSYYLASEDNSGTTPNAVHSSFGGIALDNLSDIGVSPYTLHSFSAVASSTETLLSFSFFDEPAFLHIDNISVLAASAPPVTVPEPTPIALLALAGTAAVLQGRRRKSGRTV